MDTCEFECTCTRSVTVEPSIRYEKKGEVMKELTESDSGQDI